MTVNAVPNKKELRNYLEELKSRRTTTKYRLVQILVEMSEGWHLLKEIRESADKKGVSVSHLFENLIELCRDCGFLETDIKEKYYPRLSSYRIVDPIFPC